MKMTPYIRILLRYAIGYVVAKGFLPKDLGNEFLNDPLVYSAIEFAIGAAFAGGVELWYKIAKKMGWAT